MPPLDCRVTAALAKAIQNTEQREKDKQQVCRFCGSREVRSLIDNGVLGPGYVVKEWVCRKCGRVQ